MISLSEAREIIARNVAPRDAVYLPLAYTSGRVLREEVRADQDYPAFDRSAMDGYAVRVKPGDESGKFRVMGEVRPGDVLDYFLREGECVRIFTGGMIPVGTTRVAIQEQVNREGDWITVLQASDETHIRRKAEDAHEGQLLLPACTRLRPSDTAVLAQFGQTYPLISPLPRVVHLVTGNELVDPNNKPGPTQIRDSNSTLISTLLRGIGALCVWQERAADDLENMIYRIGSLKPDTWDLLFISGGASVGDYDFGKRVLRDLGFELKFEKVDLKPGKPLVFATRGSKAAFVLPGNPVSHFVTFHVAVRVAIERLLALEPVWPLVEIELAGNLPAGEAREMFWPAHLGFSEARLRAHPLKWQSSGDLCGLISANALIQIRPNAAPAKAGEKVPCLLLDHGWGR